MTTIVTRAGKGSPLTNAEMDANLNNLNNDKLEASDIANMLETSDIGVSVQGYDADTAKKDVSQTWTLPQYGTGSTDNDLSFDIGATGGLFPTCTPTAGGALTFTNIPASPCWVTVKLVNGSNYAITAHANTKVTSTFLSTISTTGTYIITGYCDGTYVHCATPGASA